MKKISILALHLGFGGIEKSIIALANLLCERYQVEIACCYKLYDEPAFNLDSRVEVKYLMGKHKPNREEWKASIKKKKPISFVKETLYGVKVLNLRRSSMVNYIKNSDSNIIISTRDILNEWLGEYAPPGSIKIGWEHNHYNKAKGYADNVVRTAKNLDYFVLVSNALKKYYQDKLDKYRCKCVYIPNIIDKMPKNKAELENTRLISIGRLSKEKGYLDLLRIYSILSREYPKWTLDIIGDGEEREKLEKFIKIHELEGKVTLHGFRNKEYIDEMLHNSSIYLMTSYTESFGIVLLEAMSHGVPCVAFNSAEGARELINSGKEGYLIKNRNFSAMIKKIEDLINKPHERKRIGKMGRKSAEKYTGDVVKELWFKLIETGDLDE